MSRVRGVENMLRKKSITDMIVLFALFAADSTQYGKIAETFRHSDTTILGADLATLEGIGDSIEARNSAEVSFCGQSGVSAVNRSSAAPPPNGSPAPPPVPAPVPAPVGNPQKGDPSVIPVYTPAVPPW